MRRIGEEREQLTDDELRVLHELQKTSKDSINTIAKTCGFSRQKVQRIVKRFEENNIIWGYTAITDEKKEGRIRYILLIKRSMNKIDRAIVKKIANIYFDKEFEKQGIFIETGYFLHGEYDWMVVFTAKNLRDAKKYSTLILEKYPNLIAKVTLMQAMFSTKRHHIKNPDPDALLEFL
jgi:DNA-binding Lrp family transcriptional regulator